VLSSVSAADEQSLKNASTDIPPYIRRQYLALPPSVTQRTRDLAKQITANSKTNYEKAQAIEAYLRTHIKYNAEVEPVPTGWDGVDYVLFERPEGYCNYYASAMAVMARAVGIPARVASGYAVSSPQDDGLYHISENNAHSWPELYMGELGWVEFEPTAAQPEISRPVPASVDDPTKKLLELNQDDEAARGQEQRLQDAQPPKDLVSAALSAPSLSGAGGVATGGMILLGLAVAGTLALVQYRWDRRLRGLKPGAQATAEMYRFVKYTGLPDTSQATADERAAQLATLMPDADATIARVNDAYVHERYGGHELDPERAAQLRAAGVTVQKRMWHTVYMRYFGNRLHAARMWFESIPQRIRDLRPRTMRKLD